MVLDKIFAIKIKRQDGTYSDRIPIKTLAQNIQWDSTHDISVKEILGNVDLTKTIQGQLNDLQNNKISANSLSTYVGHQLQTDVNNWLTQNIDPNEVLKQTDLHGDGTIKTQYSSAEIEETSGRQYAVVKDNSDKLSVIVPWTDTDTPADMQYIWSGICTTPANESNKSIILDKMDNFEINGDLTTINHGVTIAVYFTTGNTAQSPKLTIQGSGVGALPIYYAVDNETTLEMDVNTPEPWYTFTPGLKFFTCRQIDNKTVWLLTTVDYSLISHLNRTIATQDSPEFSGIPTAPTAATNTNNNQIATTGFVHNAIDGVLDEYLKTTTEMPVNSQNPPEQPSQDRQYPVVKDSEGNLSVNVPWSSSDADAAIQKIWTGTCNTLAATAIKSVVLDHPTGFSVTNGTTIIVYFTNGNSANTPMLNVNDDIRNILYQSDANTIAAMQANTSTAISNWGAGLKIFTYYTQGSIGWVMQSPDMTNIRYLLNYKADLNSPAFTGSPTAPTPLTGDSSTKLATTAFVSSTVENISSTSERNIAENFNNSLNYEVGDYVYYNDKLYRFVLSHSAGEWSYTQVEPVSITSDLQSTKQTLNNILVDNGITTVLSNDEKAKLSSFSSTAGFTRITNNSNLVEFNYPYSRNVTTPTVSLPLSLGTGKWLVGFKFRLVPDSVVTSTSNYRINWVQGSVSYNGIGGWTTASKYLTTLNSITLQLSQNPNINYNPTGNNTITLSIKDLYIYNLDNLDEDIVDNIDFRNYIISEQNRNYQNGTVIYSLPDYGTDKTLTQEGKAADAKVVGDIFVPEEEITATLENKVIGDWSEWGHSGSYGYETAITENNIRKFIPNNNLNEPIQGVPAYQSSTKIYINLNTVDFYNYNSCYLIGFKYKFQGQINNYRQPENISFSLLHNTTAKDKEKQYKSFNDNEWNSYFKILKGEDLSDYWFTFNLNYNPSLNLDNDENQTIIYMKDFYVYDISNIIHQKYFIDYIIFEQNNNYNNGTVTYTYNLPSRVDSTISIKGKSADAGILGDFFVHPETTSISLSPLKTVNDFQPILFDLIESSDNYRKYHFYLDENSSYDKTTDGYPRLVMNVNAQPGVYLIGFWVRISKSNQLAHILTHQGTYIDYNGTRQLPYDYNYNNIDNYSGEWNYYTHFINTLTWDQTFDQELQSLTISQTYMGDGDKYPYVTTGFFSVHPDTTIEIKDFYIYNVTDIIDKEKDYGFVSFIQKQQKNYYKNNLVNYVFNYPIKLDTTLKQSNKIPDSKIIGDRFENLNISYSRNFKMTSTSSKINFPYSSEGTCNIFPDLGLAEVTFIWRLDALPTSDEYIRVIPDFSLPKSKYVLLRSNNEFRNGYKTKFYGFTSAPQVIYQGQFAMYGDRLDGVQINTPYSYSCFYFYDKNSINLSDWIIDRSYKGKYKM